MTTIYVTKNTTLPERKDFDLYPTEQSLIEAVFATMPLRKKKQVQVLDIGAGDGRWGLTAGKSIGVPSSLWGVDLRDVPAPQGYAAWYNQTDFLTWEPGTRFDVIVSNPPYYIAEECVRKAWDLLADDGQMYFLLRLAFAEGVGRYNGLYKSMPLSMLGVLSRRPSFYGGKTNGTAYGVFVWDKSRSSSDPYEFTTRFIYYDRNNN